MSDGRISQNRAETEVPSLREHAPKPHRDPEKRRLQNLRAQQKYRLKKKNRIEELEALVASAQVAINSTQPERPEWNVSTSHECWPTEPTPPELCADASVLAPQAIIPAEQVTWSHPPGMRASARFAVGSRHWLDCGCYIRHLQIRLPSSFESAWMVTNYDTLPDPYKNSLRFELECIVSALVQNCAAIGISTNMWCAEESISTFFRPSSSLSFPWAASPAGLQPSSGNLVTQVQDIFRSLKPDMRPSAEQILISHHPYIDILPFPTLRANLILHMGSFDEQEFFYDSLNGLRCWSSSSASRNNGIWTGSGTPWESRNWEAKNWFIQKWMFLLGGEDGEVVRQSRWWRLMRGEEGL